MTRGSVGLAALPLIASLLAGCASTPEATRTPLPTGLPPLAEAPPGHPEGAPLVLPFTAEAGQEVRLRAQALAGPTPVLCLASEEAWARYDAGTGEAAVDDLAGDAVVCDASADTYARESSIVEVVPRTGRYVLVVSDASGGTPGTVRLHDAASGRAVVPLPEGATVPDTLGVARPWALHLGMPVGVHFVRGRAGARLSVTAESEAFAPYVEVGAWYGEAYTPLVGEGGASGEAASVSLVLPADGVYTVRVSGDGEGGAYTLRAAQAAPEAWAERFPGGGDPAARYALLVSISDYPGIGYEQSSDLAGPRADGEAMYDLLVNTYGVPAENVVVLRDAEATREAVVEAFRRHLGQAGPEGAAFFHYAGHGTQLPAEVLPGGASLSSAAPARAEADGLDEALVLWGRGAEFAYLLDHELGALAEGLTAGHVVLALDNCHSGDGTRGEGGRRLSGAFPTPRSPGAWRRQRRWCRRRRTRAPSGTCCWRPPATSSPRWSWTASPPMAAGPASSRRCSSRRSARPGPTTRSRTSSRGCGPPSSG